MSAHSMPRAGRETRQLSQFGLLGVPHHLLYDRLDAGQVRLQLNLQSLQTVLAAAALYRGRLNRRVSEGRHQTGQEGERGKT